MDKEFKARQNAKFNLLLKRFDEWMKDGNVMIRSDIKGRYYSTQDALYKNRIESKAELLDYFVTEFNS